MNPLVDLIVAPAPRTVSDSWFWAVVTSAPPALRIRRDEEDDPLAAQPDTLVAGLTVGARVWVQLHAGRLIIHGKAS